MSSNSSFKGNVMVLMQIHLNCLSKIDFQGSVVLINWTRITSWRTWILCLSKKDPRKFLMFRWFRSAILLTFLIFLSLHHVLGSPTPGPRASWYLLGTGAAPHFVVPSLSWLLHLQDWSHSQLLHVWECVGSKFVSHQGLSYQAFLDFTVSLTNLITTECSVSFENTAPSRIGRVSATNASICERLL